MTKFYVPSFGVTSKDWQETIVDNINEDKVLPLIGNSVCNDLVFGNHQELIAGLADSIKYPRDDKTDLTQVTQFYNIMSKAKDPEITENEPHRYIRRVYLEFLEVVLPQMADKELWEDLEKDVYLDELTFSQKAERLGCPHFDTGLSLVRLAQLPLRIYLTTSYHTFLEMALERQGRTPRIEVCRWNAHLQDVDSVFDSKSLREPDKDFEPTPDEPLVYHLHGVEIYPDSLVLTEDDHLDFMATLLSNKDIVPLRVREVLSNHSLILLGYGPRNWDFRVIFRAMLRSDTSHLRPKSVSIQLPLGNAHEKAYVENYLAQEAKFEVIWGDTEDVVKQLWERTQAKYPAILYQ